MRIYKFPVFDGINAYCSYCLKNNVDKVIDKWKNSLDKLNFFLILAGTKTSEVDGISWAGATAQLRRFTAIADAELIIKGPLSSREWSLPKLPGGVSPALISYVASKYLDLKPKIYTAGLLQSPSFDHTEIESTNLGPSNCLSTGSALADARVDKLWNSGYEIGLNLHEPLLITECVPGGTTTAQAVLAGLGLKVDNLATGSVLNPPCELKRKLIEKGLKAACLKANPTTRKVLSSVGDPFQVFACSLLIGARLADQSVILGGGSQMIAVLALALNEIEPCLRADFVGGITIVTTSWLAEGDFQYEDADAGVFTKLLHLLSTFFEVDMISFSSGLRFKGSKQKLLGDYELGYIKEGVGAGALSFLAQLKGIKISELVQACEMATYELIKNKP